MAAVAGLDTHMVGVVRGTSVALGVKVAGAVLSLLMSIVLGRVLGAEQAGTYFLALALATVAAVVGRVGLDNAALRFTAASAADRDWLGVGGVYREGLRLAAIGSGMTALALFVLAPWLAGQVFAKPELAVSLRWMALAVVPLALFTLHGEILRGLKRIMYAELVLGVFLPALTIPLLLVLVGRWQVLGAVWSYTGAAVVTLALARILWQRARPPALRTSRGRFEVSRLLRSSRPLFWVAVLNLLMTWTGTLVLGIWGTGVEVGLYSVAARVANAIGLALVAVSSIAAPTFATLYRHGDLGALRSTYRKSAFLAAFMASPIVLLCAVLPRQVMSLFGPEFVAGAVVLSILAIGQFINVAMGPVGYLLMMCGHERAVRNITILGGMLNVVLNVGLVQEFGLIGVALASSGSLVFFNLGSVIAAHRLLGIGLWVRRGEPTG